MKTTSRVLTVYTMKFSIEVNKEWPEQIRPFHHALKIGIIKINDSQIRLPDKVESGMSPKTSRRR